MDTRPTFAYLDGRILPFAEARVPLDDRGLLFGESLYEVIPVTAGKPRLLAEHVQRMASGALELGLASGAPDLAVWQSLVSALVTREGCTEGLLYAQLTGGSAPRDHVPTVTPRPTFFAYLGAFVFPRAEAVDRGIAAIVLPDNRWSRRDLKTTMLLPAVLAKREAAGRGAGEALLVGSEGEVYEGASSNVLIVEGRRLVTPPQSSNLLPGTTRTLVGEVAREAGLDLVSERLDLPRLRAADEVLVTSAGKLVMPVVTLDGSPVGTGRAGPVGVDLAARLRQRYELS